MFNDDHDDHRPGVHRRPSLTTVHLCSKSPWRMSSSKILHLSLPDERSSTPTPPTIDSLSDRAYLSPSILTPDDRLSRFSLLLSPTRWWRTLCLLSTLSPTKPIESLSSVADPVSVPKSELNLRLQPRECTNIQTNEKYKSAPKREVHSNKRGRWEIK